MIINTDLIYPIGSIYLTVSSVNPSKLFGGTWEKISGGYLYACDNDISNSSYTGTSTQSHTLTISEMPNHQHSIGNSNSGGVTNSELKYFVNLGSPAEKGWWTAIYTTKQGGGKGHTHNIAYVGVYVWKRIA